MSVRSVDNPPRCFVWTVGNHYGVFVQPDGEQLMVMTGASEDGIDAGLHVLDSAPIALLRRDEVYELYLELARFLGKSGT